MSINPSESHPADLHRFLDAQAPVYREVLGELRVGDKTSHWMWFIFPQHVGLARSATAKRYGIADLDEARAYLLHPVLGERLRACCELVLAHSDKTTTEMLGHIDALKLRSCATLFLRASDGEPIFQRILNTFYSGEPDTLTLQLLDPTGFSK